MISWKMIAAGMLALLGGAAVAQNAPSLGPSLAPPAAKAPASALPSLPATPEAPATLTRQDVDAWLDGYMPYALQQADIPGAVVAVVKDGQIVTARGYGFADAAKRTPVDPARTLFRPGSVSKLVTWTAIMQLVDQHKVDLDADVNSYLDFKIPPRGGKPITIRQLMTHTAGFEERAKGIIFYDAKKTPTLEAYLKDWVPTRIYPAGSTPAYSNWGCALVGYIVQRVSGEDFDSYVERHIFQPLAMNTASFRQPLPANLAPLVATGYPKPGQAMPFEIVGPAPAGSLSASGLDMARFMVAQINGGTLGGNRILSPEVAAEMHNSPTDKVDPMSLIPPLNRMELGFFETNINGREVIGHLGDTNAFHTSLHLFMKEGVGFYVSFNSPGRDGAVQPLRIALFQNFADRYLPNVGPADGKVDAKTAAQHAQMMAGTWWGSRRSQTNFLGLVALLGETKVAVGPKGDLVIPSFLGLNGRPRVWTEIAPFVWRDTQSHDRIAAKVIDGKVVRWSMDLFAPFEVFDRVPFAKSAAWIMPALYASLAILLLTFLFWPVSWFVRRRYKADLRVAGRARQAYRATRIMAGLDLAVLGGWVAFVMALLGNLEMGTRASDPWLWLLQGLGAIIFIGAVPITVWNLWLTWTDGRRWTAKLWSVLVALAALLMLYLAAQFGLIAMTVQY